MSYHQGFITGLIITAIVTLFSPLTQYISSAIVSPGYFLNIIEHVVESGSMTRESAENYFNLKNYMVQSLIGTPVMGIITTAVVAIFMRRKGKDIHVEVRSSVA